jgi:hypothetical protein
VTVITFDSSNACHTSGRLLIMQFLSRTEFPGFPATRP